MSNPAPPRRRSSVLLAAAVTAISISLLTPPADAATSELRVSDGFFHDRLAAYFDTKIETTYTNESR